MTIIGAKLDQGAVNKANANAGMKARGEAIAEKLMAHIRDQSTSLKRYLSDIIDLDQTGRKAFRVAVGHHLKEIQRHVKDKAGTAEHDLWKSTARSAGVRLSEAVTFSKAVDAGYAPVLADMPYHAMVTASRMFLRSESAAGPTQRRGRKATPVLDKIKQYILKLEQSGELKHSQLKDVEVLVHTMATHRVPKTGSVVQLPLAA